MIRLFMRGVGVVHCMVVVELFCRAPEDIVSRILLEILSLFLALSGF